MEPETIDDVFVLPNGRVKVRLQHPVTYLQQTYEEVTLRRPTAGDLKVMDSVKGDIAKQIATTARMAGEPVGLMEAMDAADFVRVGEVFASMMGKSRSTGGTS